MPKYLIERDIPGAGELTAAELQKISARSNEAMEPLEAAGYRWHHSYVAGDKFYCVHEAPNQELIREHARRGGFPVTSISEIAAVIDSDTGRQNGSGGSGNSGGSGRFVGSGRKPVRQT
ncbi:MAG: DUF4242 domain-containing protein [Phycisphaerales bacterium]|nr:DUF4242 domain-containing protein [Phycisphaerales bacterium]MCI0675973.1 DUF4242 domain-containing protein [Phycisphaerales bacterium]